MFLRGEQNIVTAVSEFIHQCVQQNEEHEDAPDLTEFEQGMIFGKLAALEWVEGGEWNSLIKIINREADDPFNMRRSHRDILRIVNQLTEKVWWNRHQILLENISAGTEQIRCEEIFAAAKKAARRVERKYGKRNLGWDDIEWGILNGQLSALRWVMGRNGTIWTREQRSLIDAVSVRLNDWFAKQPRSRLKGDKVRKHFADLGYSEPTIAALVGHKGRSITSRYLHSADAVLLAAADAVANHTAELMGDVRPDAQVILLRA